jgi:hypothetical protein
MRKFAYVVAVACAVLGVVYLTIPGGQLPQFIPGYDQGSTHIHHMYGVAALTAAVVFLLIGVSGRRR